MTKQEPETFFPADREAWRQWLEAHHDARQAIWVVYDKKKANHNRLTWRDAVDEALCFGWIDSTARSLDTERYVQLFCKRKPKSVWSKVNKDKVAELIVQQRMTEAGYACIALAKQNGSWEVLDEVEALTLPEDLEMAFDINPGLKDDFLNLSKSAKKSLLYRLVFAKRSETRQRRIAEIIEVLLSKRK
jgi:uncharacterized protein YdeI (YjbR/CyaY-like superfamily)